jgi:hypothetical protein
MLRLNKLILSFNRQMEQVRPEGYILQGSVVRRSLHRPAGEGMKTYGPYYLWTRKINNKTVTRALTADKARIIREAIQRNRQLQQQLDKLRSLSEQIIDAVSPCVARRNRAQKV